MRGLLVLLLLVGGCRHVAPSKPALPFSIWERALGGATTRVGPWTAGAPIAEPKSGRVFVQPDLDAPVHEIVAAISGTAVRGLSLNGLRSVDDTTVGELAALGGQLTFLDLGSTPLTDASAVPLLVKLDRLVHLDLSGTKIGDPTLAALARSRLATLDVSSTRITRFDPLPASLEELAANHTRLADDSVPAIARLTALQALDLNHTRLSALGVGALSTLPGLRRLGLASTGADDLSLVILETMPGLEALSLAGTQLTDRGLLHLRGLTLIGVLNLNDTAIGDEGLAGIEQAQNLTGLGLASTRITDVTLARLGQLAALRALDVSGTRTTDVGHAALGASRSLEVLGLAGTAITHAGLARLPPSLRELVLNQVPIGDGALDVLLSQRSLERVDVRGTRLSPAAISRLEAAGLAVQQ